MENIVKNIDIRANHQFKLDFLKEIIKIEFLPLGLEDEKIIAVLGADHEFISPFEIP